MPLQITLSLGVMAMLACRQLMKGNVAAAELDMKGGHCSHTNLLQSKAMTVVINVQAMDEGCAAAAE